MSERGLVKKIETATPIERVCVARQGTVAVLMKEDDVSYVRLYDKKGQELASGEFYQEKGSFPVDIALAPDAQKLAVDKPVPRLPSITLVRLDRMKSTTMWERTVTKIR